MADAAPNGWPNRYGQVLQTVTVVALFVAGFWAGIISPIRSDMGQAEGRRRVDPRARGVQAAPR